MSLPPSILIPGSPPRVRGKLSSNHARDGLRRITPACAGKTGQKYISEQSVEDHPRMCGENAWALIRLYSSMGSPPRVRGKQLLIRLLDLVVRITPACAGKTC